MNRIKLSDEEWARILAGLKKIPGVHRGSPDICRQFVNAVLWILRTGAQWRVLPSTYGKWNSVFKHFSRWCAMGVLFWHVPWLGRYAWIIFPNMSGDALVVKVHFNQPVSGMQLDLFAYQVMQHRRPTPHTLMLLNKIHLSRRFIL